MFGILISPPILEMLISTSLIFPLILGALIFVFDTFISPSIVGELISTVGILFISRFWAFMSPSIFGISNLGPVIFIFGIFILSLGILTPTLISGISNLFLFNIIGSFISPPNILLIFNGFISNFDILDIWRF